MNKKNYYILFVVFLSNIFNAQSLKNIEVWQTKGDKSKSLEKIQIKEINLSSNIKIEINPTLKYQEIEGVGASLSHSSAYVLMKNISSEKRNKTLNELFSKKGIGIDYLRLTIGASDFSYNGNFSLNDTPNDVEMKNFNFKTDKEFFIPTLKEIVKINPNIHLMGSPWSSPAWMKTNNNMVGGELQPKYYQALSNYFVKYIQEMKKEGFNINALTIQNEPLYDKAAYPCMLMTPEQQRDFIKNNLGPTFGKNKISTQIITYDHNWDRPDYGMIILRDSKAFKYVTGTAFHAYAGNVEAMQIVHNVFPEKGIYFTEQSGGNWQPNYADNIQWNVGTLIIDGFRNWTKNVLLWNLALDENFGPTNSGCMDCRGVVTVSTNGEITKNEEYYSLGHFGKFSQKGSKRCFSTDVSKDGIKNVAICNPDNSIFVILTNSNPESKNIELKIKNETKSLEIEGNSAYTIKIN